MPAFARPRAIRLAVRCGLPEHRLPLARNVILSWRPGDRVSVRGHWWTVLESERFPDCATLRVTRAAEAEGAALTRTFVLPFDRPRRDDHGRPLAVVRARAALHRVHDAAARLHPFGALRSAAECRAAILPYQLEPALAMLRHGWPRLLIADGVGLGKTIEAGFVIKELHARTASARTIVLTPAGLRAQWCRELSTHFALAATHADLAWLRAVATELSPTVNPWSLPGVYLASHDFIKRPEVLRPLEDVQWDLLVVDEAHGVSAASDRRAAVHALACRSRRVILLTATPHDANPAEREALCDIGTTSPRSPLVVFRRTRTEQDRLDLRRTILLPVRLSPAEHRMHRLLDEYTARIWREAGARGDAQARLVPILLRKRALSSAASLVLSVRRRLDLLADPPPLTDLQLVLPLFDDDALQDDQPLGVLSAPGLSSPARERRWLSLVLETALHASRHESKVRRLARLLERIREPAIVFTEFRDTLAHLRDALASRGHPSVLLHGGMTAAERTDAQERFNTSAPLLLATDAAAEGLNLQKRCRVVIHFELPWNPARLEQRAGRVDRIGQSRRVHEIALVADATAERLVLDPITRRAAEAARAGITRLFGVLTESRVAAAVMGDDLPVATAQAQLQGSATRAPRARVPGIETEALLEAGRLRTARAWAAVTRANQVVRGPVVSSVRRRSRRAAATFFYVVYVRDTNGDVVHAEPAVLRGLPALRVPRSASATRALADTLRAEMERSQHLRRATEDCLRRVRVMYRRFAARAAARGREVEGVANSAARQLVQARLFEKRAPGAHPQHVSDLSKTPPTPSSLEADMRLVAVLFLRNGIE